MAHHDRYGLPLSTASASAADAYRAGVDAMLAGQPGAGEAFDRAIAADEAFALAHVARARMHFFYADLTNVRVRIAAARACIAANGSERERSHVETMALGMEGKSAASLESALTHLERWPRDAVIMSLPLGAFGLFAFSGMADHDQARVDLCERYADRYGDEWWFLTMHGWSHTENGNLAVGRAMTERGFAQNRNNAHGAHALAHAMFECGATDEADAFITEWLPGYDRSGILHGHIAWHQALAALEQGDAKRALAIYRDLVRPAADVAPPLNVVTDGPSLLWRLVINDQPVPRDLWDDLGALAERLFPSAGVPFADVHIAFTLAATANDASHERRLADIEVRLAQGRLVPGPIVPAIYRAARAFMASDFAECARVLEPLAHEAVRIGGSHAQREIIEDTLLAAWIKCGATAKAASLLDARLHRRPSLRDTRWRAASAA